MIFGKAEKDVELGHGDEYDGIEEYDNALPAWWLGLFYFCIVWGVIYAVHYHFIGDRSQVASYEAELAAAEVLWPTPDVTEVVVDDNVIAEGEKVYTTNCVACHGADLTGGIGPNLVDEEWIHGRENLATTIEEGIPEKGMPAWGPILGSAKVAQVAAYIDSKN